MAVKTEEAIKTGPDSIEDIVKIEPDITKLDKFKTEGRRLRGLLVDIWDSVLALINANTEALTLKADLDLNTGKVRTDQMPDALVGAVEYMGTYDATANVPALAAAGSGNKGHYYVVKTAGTSAVNGVAYDIGDWIISDGTTWDKLDNSVAVLITSVNNKTGAVLLTAADIDYTVADQAFWLTPTRTIKSALDFLAANKQNKLEFGPVLNGSNKVVLSGDIYTAIQDIKNAISAVGSVNGVLPNATTKDVTITGNDITYTPSDATFWGWANAKVAAALDVLGVKVQTLENAPAPVSHYLGKYISKPALDAAHPTANDGDYATVDAGAGSDVQTYIWDSSDLKFIVQAGNVSAIANTDELPEGATNLYHTLQRVIGSTLTGYVQATVNAAITTGDTILQAFGKLEFRVSTLEAINPVLTVNNTAPDVNGNVDVEGGTGGGGAVESNTAPDPAVSTQWIDTSITPNIYKRWSGSAWVVVGADTIPAAPGERVVTQTPTGVKVDYQLFEQFVTAANLTGANWSTDIAAATGTAGQVAYDSNYRYDCIGINQWRRTALNGTLVDLYLPDINDTGAPKNTTELDAAYPNAVIGQQVWGVNYLYFKKAPNIWKKTPITNA